MGDTGADNCFIDNHVAERNNFVPNAKCDVSFATLDGHVFQVSNCYDLDLTVTDDRGQTRDFKQRFYGCDKSGYKMILGRDWFIKKGTGIYDWPTGRWAYAAAWDDIEILGPSEFTELLKTEPDTEAHTVFLRKRECGCLINYGKCKCSGLKVELLTPQRSEISRVFTTAQKQEITLPEYLRGCEDIFDEGAASILPEQGGYEHAIETEGQVPYGPLYNLSEPQLVALRDYIAISLEKG